LEVAAVADNSGLVKLGIFGAVAYVAYTQGWLSFLGIGTAAASTTVATSTLPATVPVTVPVTTSTPVTSTPVTSAAPNTLDAIWTAIQAQAGQGPLGVDAWNYYLNAQLAPLGKVAPDPMPIFSAAISGFDRSQGLTGSQYWGIIAPALRTQLGMSGLGFYAGLSALARGYR
jgi:hypothetical protein